MFEPPATCRSCGNVFPSGFRFDGNIRDLTLADNTTVCPRCGALADVVDGTFDLVDGILTILNAPERTYREISLLADWLKSQTAGGKPPPTQEAVESQVRVHVPALMGLLTQIPRGKFSWNLFMTLLVAALTLVSEHLKAPDKTPAPTVQEVHQHIDNSVTINVTESSGVNISNVATGGSRISAPTRAPQPPSSAAQRPPASQSKAQPIRRTQPKIGRNDPCPCGSGKKYKHCHGDSTTGAR